MTRRLMRLFCVLLMIFASSALTAKPLRILSVMNRNYCHNDFTRISEYFTGVEDTGGDTILRTDNCGRAGIYLVISLNKIVSQLSDGAFLKFSYIVSDSNEKKEITFNLDSSCGNTPWIFIGITGADFHGICQNLVAWSIEIYSNDDYALKNSFLWSISQSERQNCIELEKNYEVL